MISKLSRIAPAAALLLITATPAHAATEAGPLDVNVGLMIWTVLIFVIVLVALRRFAWPSILGAVEAREEHIRELLGSAERDRAEAATLLAEQQRQLDETRAKVQETLAESRTVGERLRDEVLAQARREHEELMARARRDIDTERAAALDSVRREAVDLAIAAAEKLVHRTLDGEDNRRLVQGYLGQLEAQGAATGA
jgi:F-type H+-transporting ATPase subunit b